MIFSVVGSMMLMDFSSSVLTYNNPFFGPNTGQCGRTPLPKSTLPVTFASRQIDDYHVGAIRAGLADAGVSVDRNVGEFAVRRCRDFVPGYSTLRDFGHLFSGNGIDDAETVVSLIRHQQKPARPEFGAGWAHINKESKGTNDSRIAVAVVAFQLRSSSGEITWIAIFWQSSYHIADNDLSLDSNLIFARYNIQQWLAFRKTFRLSTGQFK